MSGKFEKKGENQTMLSQKEKEFLDKNGYLNLGKLLSDAQLDQIRKKTSDLLLQEGENAGMELASSPHIRHPKEEGADRLGNLVNKGIEFDIFYSHPKVLAAISHVLGAHFKLSSLNYRAAKPGAGLQKLHADWHEGVKNNQYMVCNSIWLLDDFTLKNGATRVVPGTHLNPKLPQEVLEDPISAHPEEILIEAPAGAVVVFNSHTWHGGTQNQTSSPRRAVHSYFCQRDQPQQTDQAFYLTKETASRIPEDALSILGIQKSIK